MNTTDTMMAMPSSAITKALKFPPVSQIWMPSLGRLEITDAKIRMDMPLPTPRWVMSSPSHMIMAVPAVSVSTINATLGPVKVSGGKMSGMFCWPEWNRKAMPVDCSSARTTVT